MKPNTKIARVVKKACRKTIGPIQVSLLLRT